MSGLVIGSHWCNECRRAVNPAMDVELKCPFCDGGFVEEMSSRVDLNSVPALVSDRSLSPWTPSLLSMVDASSQHSRSRRGEERREEEEEDDSDLNHEFPELLRIRHRTSTILRLLQSLRNDIRQQPESFQRERERDTEGLSNRENLLLIDPFTQTLVGHESSSNDENPRQDFGDIIAGGMSPGDFFVGPGLDLLLQHLTDIGSSRRGTPPARREAMNALPTVKIQEVTGCSVCLDDFAIDAEAKELPCKHKFHGDCILPWLKLHGSCPICRYQLPASDHSKVSGDSGNINRMNSDSGGGPDGVGGEDRDLIPFLSPNSVRYEF